MSEKLLKLEQLRVRPGFNPRSDYGDIADFVSYLDANGVRLIKPLDVVASCDDKGITIPDSWDIVDGHRTYAAVLGMGVKPIALRCNILEKLKDGEDIQLTWLRNQGKHLSPWEQASVVEKLTQRNYSQSQIAKKLNISDVRVSRLGILTDLPEWISEAGLKGQLSATLVWQLYDDAVETNGSKIPNTIKALEKQRKKIFAEGVTARDFDFSSPIAKLQAELKEARERAETERKAKEVKEAELRAATEAARIAKEAEARAQTDKVELEKTHKEQDKGKEELAKLALQDAAVERQASVDASQTSASQTSASQTSASQTSATQVPVTSNAAGRGQGETESARRKGRTQALIGMIAVAADTQSLTKDCKNRLGDAIHRLNDIQKHALELMGLTE